MTISISLELPEGFEHELLDALDDEVRTQTVETSNAVAHTAQQTHPWQNRTGLLESETKGSIVVWGDLYEPRGISVDVLGETHYGSYLEADGTGPWSWLWPAWRANEPYAAADLDRALQRGADRAGWGE